MTENIFLSYRRDDSRGYTNAIYTLLELHFPADSIFMDVDTLIPGSDFVQSLQDAVENCDIFLAVIGSRWENIEDKEGRRRLDNPEDFVRIEVAHALERGIPVIPVLVDGAQMPFSGNLPENLKDLARRHAFSIGDHMRSDMQRLIKVLDKTFERLDKERLEQEKKEAERLAKTQAETERKAREEEEQKAKAQAEADRKAQEQVEAEQKANEQAEADRKVAERKAKKEAEQKARALAAVEKKEADDKKRLSRQKTKTTTAKQEEKSTSPSPSALKKIPVWVWPVAGVVLITIGYVIIGGFLPSQTEAPPTTEAAYEVVSTITTSTPIPETTIIPTAVITAVPIVEPPAGAEATNLKTGAVMVYVPSGEFIMGSDSEETNESPAHTVYLDGFWIGKKEVTNDMYSLCIEADACVMNHWQTGSFNDESLTDHPVVGMSWKQADNYCRWSGGYLPTEAQWEKAARGTDGRTYPWGEDIDNSLANYGGNVGGTSPVGSYPEGVSPYGLLDMAGNVGEYVADWYDSVYYPLSTEGDPFGPEDGLERAWRGGYWNSSENNLRVTKRTVFPREWDFGFIIGFRCANSATPQGEPPAGAEAINPEDSVVMVYVPSGDFIMGSDSGESDESPAHTVYLDGFWIYQTEVTNDMYRLCVEAGACVKKDDADFFNDDSFADHPVMDIDWKKADFYCRWAGGDLPTEAEWEKAARGPDGRTYPWGEGIDISLANYDGNSGGTSPVGSYLEGASPYGLLDMAGNVGEFVADWYDPGYYEISPSENPTGPEDGLERVVRGGSWNSSESNLRVTERSTAFPSEWFDILGFRCVISQLP